MIITKLVGGLGNQMFQYAAGRALALRRGTEVFVDGRGFAQYKVHAYGLDCFNAKVNQAPEAMLPRGADGYLQRLVRAWTPGGRIQVVREQAFTFQPSVIGQSVPAYLEGYWQSERYFEDHADLIRHDFTFAQPPSAPNAAWLDRIARTLAVSLHVRRGDYVTNPEANKFHGTCGIDYYLRALHLMRQRLAVDPELFVFSDDPCWVRANLPLEPFVHHFVSDNDAKANYEDLRLMASCRHHIIANSTFSWWGAWLNASPGKIVIAPERWFRTGEPKDDDLIPSGWLRA